MVQEKLEDIIADVAVFVGVSSRDSFFGGQSGKSNPIGDWDGSLKTVEDLMRAGFVVPLPRNKLTSVQVNLGPNGGTATINLENPYGEVGLYGTVFKQSTSYEGSTGDGDRGNIKSFKKARMNLLKKVSREYPYPKNFSGEEEKTLKDSGDVERLNDLYVDHKDFVKMFLAGLVKNSPEWRDLIQERRILREKRSLLGTLKESLGSAGNLLGREENKEYLKDYVGYKYIFNIEDMSPIWICARIREDINSEEVGNIKKLLLEKYRGSFQKNLSHTVGEALGLEGGSELDKYKQLWVFIFHGFISNITESYTRRNTTLSLGCKSFLEYFNTSYLKTHYVPIKWLHNPTLDIQSIVTGSNGGEIKDQEEWEPWLSNWFNNKSPKVILAELVKLVNSSYTYLGRLRFWKTYFEDFKAKLGDAPLRVKNFFHYDYFWLPIDIKDELGILKKSLKDSTEEEDFSKGEEYPILRKYYGGLDWITSIPQEEVPSLAEDIYWLLDNNNTFEELAIRWWAGNGDNFKSALASKGEFIPDDNLDLSFSMRNRWKPRVGVDPYIIDNSIFTKAVVSGFNLSDLGQLTRGSELLDRINILINSTTYVDGRGNLILQLCRWDDFPRLKGWDTSNAKVSSLRKYKPLDNGWSYFNNLKAYVNSYPNDPERNIITGLLTTEGDAVFLDYDSRYLILDNERSYSFTFDESKVLTQMITQGSLDWIELDQALQLLVNQTCETLDVDGTTYAQTKYGIRQKNSTLPNPQGQFRGLFIGGANPSITPPTMFLRAYNQALFRREFAKCSTGRIVLGHRVDLQLGRPIIHVERAKIAWVDSISHSISVGGTSETVLNLSMVRDVSDLVGNSYLESLAVSGWDYVNRGISFEKVKEDFLDIDYSGRKIPNKRANGKVDISSTLAGIDHIDVSRARDPRCSPQLRVAVQNWVSEIDEKLKLMSKSGSVDWKLKVISVYRDPEKNYENLTEKQIQTDLSTINGHYSGNSLDIRRSGSGVYKLADAVDIYNAIKGNLQLGFEDISDRDIQEIILEAARVSNLSCGSGGASGPEINHFGYGPFYDGDNYKHSSWRENIFIW